MADDVEDSLAATPNGPIGKRFALDLSGTDPVVAALSAVGAEETPKINALKATTTDSSGVGRRTHRLRNSLLGRRLEANNTPSVSFPSTASPSRQPQRVLREASM